MSVTRGFFRDRANSFDTKPRVLTRSNSFNNKPKLFTRSRTGSDHDVRYDEVDIYNNAIANHDPFIALRRRFYNNLVELNQPPADYEFDTQDLYTAAIVLALAFMALPVYIVGSASHEEYNTFLGITFNEYVVGAAYANLVQNIFYAYCFVKATQNFKNENTVLLSWSLFWGLITAYVPTVAMYSMGFRKDYYVPTILILTTMTLLSSGLLSFFAMYESFKRAINLRKDNPLVRKFAMQQLRLYVANDPRKLSLLAEHNHPTVVNIGLALGIFLTVSQVLSLYPWLCDSERSLEWTGSLVLAWMLSTCVFNLPNLVLASTFSGFDQGPLLAQLGHQCQRYLTGEETYYGTFSETLNRIGLIVVSVFTFRECLYSSVTSSDITLDECPRFGNGDGSIGDLIDFLLLANVNYGTIWGNFILCMLTVGMLFAIRTQLSDIRDWINSGPIEEVEAVVERCFPDSWDRVDQEAMGWKVARSTLAPTPLTLELLDENDNVVEELPALNIQTTPSIATTVAAPSSSSSNNWPFFTGVSSQELEDDNKQTQHRRYGSFGSSCE